MNKSDIEKIVKVSKTPEEAQDRLAHLEQSFLSTEEEKIEHQELIEELLKCGHL